MKNKLDNMKKEYTWFKNVASGFGWNKTNIIVECSKEWWTEIKLLNVRRNGGLNTLL
jgi:hypothetical protein